MILGERALQAQWRLGDQSQLTLLANLGATPAPLRRFRKEKVSLVMPADVAQELAQGVLPPWSVTWALKA